MGKVEITERQSLADKAHSLGERISATGFTVFWYRSAVVGLLYAAQGSVCSICRGYLRKRDATIDHVLPKSRGGRDTLANFLLAHHDCNQQKKNALPTEPELELLSRVHDRLALFRSQDEEER